MPNEKMEFDIVVNGKQAKLSIEEVDKAQDDLDKNTTKTTKSMKESWVSLGAKIAVVTAGLGFATNEAMKLERATFGLSSATREYIKWASIQYNESQEVIAGFVQTGKAAGLSGKEIAKMINTAVALGRKFPHESVESFIDNLTMLNTTGETQGYIVDVLEQKYGAIDLKTLSLAEKMATLDEVTKGVNAEFDRSTTSKIDKTLQRIQHGVSDLGSSFLKLLDSSGGLFLFNKGVLLASTTLQGLSHIASIAKISVKNLFGMDTSEDLARFKKDIKKSSETLDELLDKAEKAKSKSKKTPDNAGKTRAKEQKVLEEEAKAKREKEKLLKKSLGTSVADWQRYYETIGELDTAWLIQKARLGEQFIDLTDEQFNKLSEISKKDYFKKFQKELDDLGKSIEDNLGSQLENVLNEGKFNFKSFMNSIISDMVRAQAIKPLSSMIGGGISNMLGGLFHTGTTQVKHTGGFISQSHHDGSLRTDERMARLQVGEAIVNRTGAKLNSGAIAKMNRGEKVEGPGGNVTTVDIKFEVTAIDASSFNQYLVRERTTIENIINRSISSNGSVKQTIKQVVA